MEFITSKTGITIVGLVGVFAFGYLAITGVFGSTTFGVTLNSNSDLNNGLISHWTFDEYDNASSTGEIVDRLGVINGDFDAGGNESTGSETQSASTIASTADAGLGSPACNGYAWDSTTNSNTQNDTYDAAAGGAFDSGIVTERLDHTNFGFSLPASVPIAGVLVEIDKYESGPGGSAVTDHVLHLIVGGSVDTTENKADTATNWPGSDTNTYVSYGGSADDWGVTTLTSSDVNATNFGVAFCAEAQANNTDGDVDHIRVTAYYAENVGSKGTTTKPGRLGQAHSFDGVNDHVDFGNVGGGIQTIAFWTKLGSTTNNRIIEVGPGDYIEANSAGEFEAVGFPGATVYTNGSNPTTSPRVDEWIHVTITDSTGVTGSNFEIGSTTEDYFDGVIDDLRIYDRELSAAEAKRLYELGATTRIGKTLNNNPELENGLIVHYPFDGAYVDTSYEVPIFNRSTSTRGAGTQQFGEDGTGILEIDPTIGSEGGIDTDIVGSDIIILTALSSTFCDGGVTCYLLESRTLNNGSLNWSVQGGSPLGYAMTAKAFANDGSSVFIVSRISDASECVLGGSCWLVESRSLVDGSFNWSTTTDFTASNDIPEDVTYFSGNIYIAGFQNIDATDCPVGGLCNRIESRSASDGSLNWSTTTDTSLAEGSGGSLFGDWPKAIVNDGTNLVFATVASSTESGFDCGNVSLSEECWYMEARALSDGSFVWGVISDPSTWGVNYSDDLVHALAEDGTDFFVGGEQGADNTTCSVNTWNCWRVESRSLSNGGLNWATTTEPNPTTEETKVSALAVDDNYVYAVGGAFTSDGCSTDCWKIMAYDKSDGSYVWSANSDPSSDASNEAAVSVVSDGDYVYILGNKADNTCSLGYDNCLLLEKRVAATGELLTTAEVSSGNDAGTNNIIFKDGALGQGVSFNGDNSYINMGTTSVGTLQTFAFWLKRDTTGSIEKLVNIDGTDQIEIDASNDVLGTSFPGTTIVYIDGEVSSTINDTKWHHIAVTDTTGVNPTTFELGRVGDSYSTSTMDDFRAYDRVLPQSEIQRLYELGATSYIGTTINTNDDLKNGLVGHWTFDGKDIDLASSTKEVYDTSVNENHGDWKSHASTTRPGVIGQAIVFDGTDDRIAIPDDDTLDFNGTLPITISAWVRHQDPANGGFDTIARKGDNYMLEIQSERLTFSYFTGGWNDYRTDAVTILQDTWHHVAATFTYGTGGSIILYVDGVAQDGTWISGDGSAVGTANTGDLAFGSTSGGGQYWQGNIDDVRLYDRILSADEITRLYQLGN